MAMATAVVLGCALGAGLAAPAREALPFEPVTADARKVVADAARAATVTVRRTAAPQPRVRVPGGARVEGRGWWAGAGRVVTAFVLVEGWPRADDDVIEVVDAAGKVYPAAVGLSEAALGLVVLDVPGLAAPSAAVVPFGDESAVSPGRALFADGGEAPLQRLLVGPRGAGELAYHWTLDGAMPPGTPLFDGRGRLVTLVGRVVGPGAALALPVKALGALLERDGWR